MAYFPFICKLPGGSKFAVERADVEHNTELQKIGVFCPCHGKKWGEPDSKIELDVSYPSVGKSMSMRSKENSEASREAEHAAARDREYLNREDPEVSPNTGIRRSVVDTINERVSKVI